MRIPVPKGLLFTLPLVNLIAQTPALQMNTVYVCNDGVAFKVFSCASTADFAACELQNYRNGQAFQRGQLLRKQLTDLLVSKCHAQTPAEAQANPQRGEIPRAAGPAPARAAAQPNAQPAAQAGAQIGAGGFKVGDTVRVLFSGWVEAKILEVHGNSYLVHMPNGVDVSKMWPIEVRRVGKLTAQDHAVGQYDVSDRVQVLVNGRWMEGEVRGQNLNLYSIKVPGYRGDFDSDLVSATPDNIRISNTPPPPPPAKRAAGQVPKPGLASCGNKYDGRWEQVPAPLMRVVFRGGKATISEPGGFSKQYDCFIADGKLQFFEDGEFKPVEYYTLLPNNDGTLQSELGPLKKMGN
jgi:hypothetical protein